MKRRRRSCETEGASGGGEERRGFLRVEMVVRV